MRSRIPGRRRGGASGKRLKKRGLENNGTGFTGKRYCRRRVKSGIGRLGSPHGLGESSFVAWKVLRTPHVVSAATTSRLVFVPHLLGLNVDAKKLGEKTIATICLLIGFLLLRLDNVCASSTHHPNVMNIVSVESSRKYIF